MVDGGMIITIWILGDDNVFFLNKSHKKVNLFWEKHEIMKKNMLTILT